jgi:hypothetical protein
VRGAVWRTGDNSQERMRQAAACGVTGNICLACRPAWKRVICALNSLSRLAASAR